jgi:hypothetical protein
VAADFGGPACIAQDLGIRAQRDVCVDLAAAAERVADEHRDAAVHAQIEERLVPANDPRLSGAMQTHLPWQHGHVVRELAAQELFSALQHAHRVAGVGEPARRNGAPVSGADDDHVVVAPLLDERLDALR